jgi:hypothetical protein
MMRLKRFLYLTAAVLASASLEAQDFSQTAVLRGPVTELQKDSVAVWLRNDGIRDLNITGMWSCAQWGDTLLSLRADRKSVV